MDGIVVVTTHPFNGIHINSRGGGLRVQDSRRPFNPDRHKRVVVIIGCGLRVRCGHLQWKQEIRIKSHRASLCVSMRKEENKKKKRRITPAKNHTQTSALLFSVILCANSIWNISSVNRIICLYVYLAFWNITLFVLLHITVIGKWALFSLAPDLACQTAYRQKCSIGDLFAQIVCIQR